MSVFELFAQVVFHLTGLILILDSAEDSHHNVLEDTGVAPTQEFDEDIVTAQCFQDSFLFKIYTGLSDETCVHFFSLLQVSHALRHILSFLSLARFNK